MRIKVDEDLPRATIQMLRERGYQAEGAVEQGMGGWKDPALWQAVQAEPRLLVTADKGFADVRIYPPGSHAGVLLLRPDRAGIRPMVELLERVLTGYDLEVLAGATTVATRRSIRIRRTGV